MPGQFILEGGCATFVNGGENDIDQEKIFDEYVVPLKFVHNVFFKIDGTAEVWCELEFASEHPDNEIKINSVDFEFNDIGPKSRKFEKPNSATTCFTALEENRVPLLQEDDTDGNGKPQWCNMYKNHDWLDLDDGYYNEVECDNKEHRINDKVFCYDLGHEGSEAPLYHLYTTPVEFRVVSRDSDNNQYRINRIRKQNPTARENPLNAESPHLLPQSTLSDVCSHSRHAESENIEAGAAGGEANELQYLDTISIWMKWNEDDLCVPKDDISYHFRYVIDSKSGNFKYVYPHYILPESSVLMGRSDLMDSLSEDAVEEFHPRDPAWMFREWEEEYGVADMRSARTTRSKAENTDHVFNSARIAFPALRSRLTALQFALVIISGWLVQSVFSSLTVQQILSLQFSLQAWSKLSLVVIFVYIIFKGHGPPPYFPSFLHWLIVPLERHVLSPIRKKTNKLKTIIGRYPKKGFGWLKDRFTRGEQNVARQTSGGDDGVEEVDETEGAEQN